MNTNEIYGVFVAYADGTGGKRRPVLIQKMVSNGVRVFRITSKYAEKSEAIKRNYFEISDWQEVGLQKPSWIDLQHEVVLSRTENFKLIGELSQNDIEALIRFIEQNS